MQFSEIIGQEKIKAHLIQSVIADRVSHAQLFMGPEGCGSLALALAYAQFIACQDRKDSDSCGNCTSCRKYNKLIHPDLHFSYPFFAKHKEDTALNFLPTWRKIFLQNPYLSLEEWRKSFDAENKQANINIAECHQIMHTLSFKTFESAYKILILWLPEYLAREGNTLLKLIEEPRPKTVLLLVAQNQGQILNTILSRTQLIKISRLSNEDITAYLIEKKGIAAAEAKQIAYLSEGNVAAALQFLNEVPNDHFDLFSNWMRITASDQGNQIIQFVEQAAKMGRENQKYFLKYSIKLIRETILILSGVPHLMHLTPLELAFINKFSGFLAFEQAAVLVEELEQAYRHIERNANPKILFLDVSLRLIEILKFNLLHGKARYLAV